uniref:DH domain-containing protein n=1 Tax=Ciona intestinalis TaxID=7719 RepID=H2XVV8_CIOIN
CFNFLSNMVSRIRAVDLIELLKEKLVFLSGGRDEQGGAILTFPASQNNEKIKSEDLKCLLSYLTSVPSEEVLQLGFTVVVDMRGSTWNAVKPLLKVLQDNFHSTISSVFIIKPDNFWQKQRTNFGSNKFSFEVHTVSVDGLTRAINPRQLTPELGGLLSYDHDEWIELRISFEEFIRDALDVLDKLYSIEHQLTTDVYAADQETAKQMTDDHIKLQKKITNAPIEQLEAQGNKLLKRINGSHCDADSGFSGSSNGVVSGNSDFQSTIPRIHSLLEKLRATRNRLQNIWHMRKTKLEQCYQLRLFQHDANKMFDWIKQNRTLFIGTCNDIGNSQQQASDLQESHRHFATNSMSVYVNVHRVMLVANRLLEAGHYAEDEIRGISAKLDLGWKVFAAALDERSRLMALAVKFHQRVDRFVSTSIEWRRECENNERYPMESTTTVASISVIEQSLQKHTDLHDRITEAYHDVCDNGKELLDFLQKPTTSSNDDVISQLIDYSSASQQVLDSIHNVFHHNRELEKCWNERKTLLAQRHQLRVYEHDVHQVLQWIGEHGEAFLTKYSGIGKSLHRATQMRKRHEDFEDVAQNTYTNAEKLLEAAEQLAQSGDCDPHEIFQVARNLEEQIRDFVRRVERRRNILDMSVSFNTNLKELWNAHDGVKSELQGDDVADSLEGAEERADRFRRQRYRLIESFIASQQEAKNLLHHIRCASVEDTRRNMAPSIQHVETVLRQLQTEQSRFEDFCADHESRLDLALQFRSYEREVAEMMLELGNWDEDMTRMNADLPMYIDATVVEQRLSQTVRRYDVVHTQTLEVANKAQEILNLLEQSELDMVCHGSISVSVRVRDLSEQLQQRMKEIQNKSLNHRVMLERFLHLRRLEALATQVQTWIFGGEEALRSASLHLTNQRNAEQCRLVYEQSGAATEKTRDVVVQVQAEASRLRETEFGESAREVEETTRRSWQALARHEEDRLRLIVSASKFYQTSSEVCTVLDSLQTDYRRPQTFNGTSDMKAALGMRDIIMYYKEKHEEQKEQFLHACTLARKLATEFLKIIKRTKTHHPKDQFVIGLKMSSNQNNPDYVVRCILEDLLQRENKVLQLWNSCSSLMHRWQQYQDAVDEMLKWLHTTGGYYDITLTIMTSQASHTWQIYHPRNRIKTSTMTSQSRLSSFNAMSSSMIERDRSSATTIQQLQNSVTSRYDRIQFYRKSEKFVPNFEELSISSRTGYGTLSSSSGSMTSPDAQFRGQSSSFKSATQQQSKDKESMSRQNKIMREILQTERIYVKDLDCCITNYMSEMNDDNPAMPSALRGQTDVIFGNIVELHRFHSEIFLKELEKFEQLPGDLGHCFVTWASHFNLYVTYCQNKPTSNQVLMEHGGDFFQTIQSNKNLPDSISSFLIKPVQRITKYQLLLKDLASCCKSEISEINDGLEVMLSVPRRANDALHLSMMTGFAGDVAQLGEIVMQETFQVVDTKQLIRKGRERHLFLFELNLIVCKESKDNSGKTKYI